MAVKVKKPRFIRELGAVDISQLKPLIRGVSERVWDMEDERKENKFECFHHTRHIIFRFIVGMRDHRDFYYNPIWSVWENDLKSILYKVI